MHAAFSRYTIHRAQRGLPEKQGRGKSGHEKDLTNYTKKDMLVTVYCCKKEKVI